MRLIWPLAGLAALSAVHAAERIVAFGDTFGRANELVPALRAAGFDVQRIDAVELGRIDTLDAQLAIIAPDGRCPPDSRPAIDRFLRRRGNVIVVGAGAFDYTPRPVQAVPAVDLANAAHYRVQQPNARGPNGRYPVEPTRVTPATTPDGRAALGFRTYLRGMNDTMLEFAVNDVRDAKRSVLTFWARGDAYADLLAIEIVDTRGGKWLGFVPLAGEWRRQAVTLADLLPRGWSKPGEVPPRLNPAEIATVSLGIDAGTIWREKPMEFFVGGIELAEEAGGLMAPTSGLTAMRVPWRESKTAVPAWLFNPFEGTRRVADGAASLRSAADPGQRVTIPAAWLCPTPLVFHPGVQMGTDHRRELDTKAEREQRRIPLWRQGADGPVVAELRVLAGGPNEGAGVALFGIAPAVVAAEKALRDSVVATATHMVRQPKIAAVTINTSAAGSPGVVPTLRVRVQNPLNREIRGRIAARVAKEMLTGAAPLTLPARGGADVLIQLEAVPPNFPFEHFDWRVTLELEGGGRDELADVVDVERALLHALAHHVHTQRQFPDGRISHHYFGDAYGVRALFAYLDLVRREPERRQRNRDRWAATSLDDIRACGLRFVDMLLTRQNEDGSIPMGYGEQSSTYNVADGGQIALSMGQMAPLLDPARREACWQFCRRFAAWAETFYVDAARSKELMADLEPKKQPQARAGHYGLGSSRGVRNPLGPSWVLSDILGAQLLLAYVDPNPDFRFIADRNVLAYLDAGYPATGYFQAEALAWAWLDAVDSGVRTRIAESLTTTFVPPLLAGREHDMFELGARSTLRALPMIYYRRMIADSAEVRSALLKYVWSFGSESSERSMRRLAEAHPKPHHGESIAASKYASFSAIWAVELLEPGASLLRVPGFPRGGPAEAGRK